MYCHKCGNQLAEGAAFCSKCGAKMNSTVEANEVSAPVPTNHQNSDGQADVPILFTKKERLVMCLMGPFVIVPLITIFMLKDGDIEIGVPWIIVNVVSIAISVLIFFIVRNMVRKRIEHNKKGGGK